MWVLPSLGVELSASQDRLCSIKSDSYVLMSLMSGVRNVVNNDFQQLHSETLILDDLIMAFHDSGG